MKYFFVFAIILMLGSHIVSAARCICSSNFDPVCGVNGRTYSNRCQLGCNRVKLAHRGRC